MERGDIKRDEVGLKAIVTVLIYLQYLYNNTNLKRSPSRFQILAGSLEVSFFKKKGDGTKCTQLLL